MKEAEIKLEPSLDIEFDKALEGLAESGKAALALVLLGVIYYVGLKKMVSGGKST